MKYCIVDVGYKTPVIAKLLLDDGVKLVFPYKRPIIKAVFSRGMSMFMINTMTVTSVLLTIC